VSEPAGGVARAVRQMALEEPAVDRGTRGASLDPWWKRVCDAIAEENPVLAQFLQVFLGDALEDGSDPMAAYRALWDAGYLESADGEAAAVTDLLALAGLAILLLSETDDTGVVGDGVEPDEVGWARHAVALGAADMILARYFMAGARVGPQTASACTVALARALAAMEDASSGGGEPDVAAVLRALAGDYALIARRKIAKAA
jgi:hypothetical protein